MTTKSKPEILKTDWPRLWPYIVEAYNFLGGFPELDYHDAETIIVKAKKYRKALLADAANRFNLAYPSGEEAALAESREPGTQAELERAGAAG